MIENNQGKVVPFGLSVMRMRRRAEEHARRGRTLEAIELYRRAAQEDEMPTGWLYLARLLRSVSCYEQAMRVLYRMIGREDVPPDAWLELAKCQRALDMREGMQDSLYHLLDEDPYSDTADEGRDMLAELDAQSVSKEPFRLPLVGKRAMQAWYCGDRALAVRRFRRAARMSSHPGGVYATMAMLTLTSPMPERALTYAARALRLEPKSIRVRTMAAVCFAMQGRKRMAQALLAGCIPEVKNASEENMLLSTMDTLGLYGLKRQCLTQRLRLTPYRAELLRQQADEFVRMGDTVSAERLWNTVMRIDPLDVGALAMLRTLQHEPECFAAGTQMQRAKMRMEARLAAIVFHHPEPAEFASTSEMRAAVDWCVAQEKHIFRELVLKSIMDTDTEETRTYLTELLTSPNVHPNARQELLEAFAEAGRLSQRPVLMGQCVAIAQAAQRKTEPHAMEKRFLMLVMLETKRHHMTAQMVSFAAEAWRCMTRQMRRNAVGKASYAYVKAIEIICLRMAGREDAVRSVVGQLNTSHRRVGRAMMKLIMTGAVKEGDTDDEVHQF